MSFESVFALLSAADSFLWGYVGFILVVLAGLYFSFTSKFFQLRVLLSPLKTLAALRATPGSQGVSPLRLYFASVGGMIGLGNIVMVMSAVLIGGPGSLFWLWISSLFGMLIKYSETYLGLKYRVKNARGGYDGGPMYFLAKAFSSSKFASLTVPAIAAVLLCIYGIEVGQFVVLADTFTNFFAIDRMIIVLILLSLVLYGGFGGVERLAKICSGLMPIFIILYVGLCLFVIAHHLDEILPMLALVVKSAFVGHAPLGGFIGGSMMLACQFGAARAVYSGDIGIGFDSVINSESKALRPEHQARLAIFAGATDSFICTMSILVVLLTGIWKLSPALAYSECVSSALAMHIPFASSFMACLIFLTGYTTLIAYLAVGTKCANYLFPNHGKNIYFVCAVSGFIAFSYLDQEKALLIMSLSGVLLMIINIAGIWRLRREIEFVDVLVPAPKIAQSRPVNIEVIQ